MKLLTNEQIEKQFRNNLFVMRLELLVFLMLLGLMAMLRELSYGIYAILLLIHMTSLNQSRKMNQIIMEMRS